MRTQKTASTRSYGLSEPIHHYNWWELREGGTEEKEMMSGLLFPIHMPWQRRGIEKSDALENMSAQAACRVTQPRCTKCTTTSLRFLTVWLSPWEPRKCFGRIGTSIKSLSTKNQKCGKDTGFIFLWSTRHSNNGSHRNGIKTPIKQKEKPTSYWIDGGSEQERWRMESALFCLAHHGTDDGWKKSTIPRSKPTCRAPQLCN